MGSSYFVEPNMGNERGGSSSSSRKGKKSISEKPKQPRRGLGVAQLEKILHGQMGSLYGPYPGNFNQEDMRVQKAYSSSCFSYSSTFSSSSSSYGFHPSMMMGLGEYDRRQSIIYGDSLPSSTTSGNTSNGILDSQYFAQPNMTRQLLNLHDSQPKKSKKQRSKSLESNSQNSDSGDTQKLDLELKLSL